MKIEEVRLSQEVSNADALELTDGQKVRSVIELLEAIKNMGDESFNLHISKYNNDFGEWIIDNYRDENLALKLSKAKNKKKIKKILEKALRSELKMFIKGKKNQRKSIAGKMIKIPKKKNKILTEFKESIKW